MNFDIRLSACVLLILLLGNIACNRQAPAPKAPAAKSAARQTKADSSKKIATLPVAAVLPILIDAPEFKLTDQLGHTFGTDELRGRVWVANFIFTHCTATCPKQTENIAALQRRAQRWPDWDRVRLVSITVDPERDTPARLHEYADLHQADHEHWRFLTGDRAELTRISKDGFKFPVSDASSSSSAPITHSSRFVLIDSQRRIRGFYDGLSEDDFAKLLTDMRIALSESDPVATGPVHIGVPSDVFDPPWMEKREAEQLATRGQLGVYHDFEFIDSLEASGIQFVNRAVPDAARNFKKSHYDHANGIAVADVDGDGMHDLYFVSQVGGNQLWRNLGGGRFENTTASAGVGLEGRVGVAASFADTDNDGDADLFVTTTRHGNAFFENDGRGQFRNRTADAGLESSGHSSSAEFFDYDLDGKLDLFLTNVGVFTTDEISYSGDPQKRESPYWVAMKDAFAGHLFPARSEKNILYRNQGDNKFQDVTQRVGLLDDAWSGDATPLDINQDGWIDLYVLNMQGNDECYLNLKGEHFERMSDELFSRVVWGGMGVKSFDFDNDSSMDLLITNMHADMWELPQDTIGPGEKSKAPAPRVPPVSYLRSRVPIASNIFGNALYTQDKEGTLRDVAEEKNAEMFWPWGLSVGDLNADGFQDVFIASCMNYPFRYHVNSLLLNDRGKMFRDAEFILGVEPRRDRKTAAPWFELDCSGDDKDHELAADRTGRLIVWGALGTRSSVIFDLDQDGDLDIVTNDFHSPPMVLVSDLNERQQNLHYLKIQLKGTKSNRDGLGARVQVETSGGVFTQVHDGQSGYLSQSALPLYFGLGDAKSVDKISISWPGGVSQVMPGPIAANQSIVIEETIGKE